MSSDLGTGGDELVLNEAHSLLINKRDVNKIVFLIEVVLSVPSSYF